LGLKKLSTGNAQLDAYFSDLKTLAQDEITRWVKTWPPITSSKANLIKVRQMVAAAALKVVDTAKSAGIDVHDNVKALANNTTAESATAAVEEIYSLISSGKMSQDQLKERFVFDMEDVSKKPATPVKEATPASAVAAKTVEAAATPVKEATPASAVAAKTVEAAATPVKEATPAPTPVAPAKEAAPAPTVAAKTVEAAATPAKEATPAPTPVTPAKEAAPAPTVEAKKAATATAAREKVTATRVTAAEAAKTAEAATTPTKEATVPLATAKAAETVAPAKEATVPLATAKAAETVAPAKEAAAPTAEKTEKIDAATVTPMAATASATPASASATIPEKATMATAVPNPGITLKPPDDPKPPSGNASPWDTPSTAVGDFYADITDILTSLGRGLANAQKELDIGAIQMQKAILEDETLSGYGLSANWFVMPEAEFNMRMELGVSEEEKIEGTVSGKAQTRGVKMMAALSNAKYNSLYESESKQESSLRVRFVPVPMPTVVKIPNVVGSPVASARAALAGASVNAMFISEKGEAWTADSGKVALQSIPGGEVMLAEKVLVVTVNTTGVPPASPKPSTPAPSTPAPSTPAPSTPAPSTPAPSTPSTPPASPAPSTPAPSTPSTPPAPPTPSTPPASTINMDDVDPKLRAPLTDLISAGKDELTRWVKTWPPINSSKANLIKVRQMTGAAAAKFVSAADSIKAEISDYVREVAGQSDPDKAKAVVEGIYDQINKGKLSKEQLEALFVFYVPGGTGK